MKKGVKAWAAAAAVAAMAVSAPAQAACWSDDTMAAAKVREFETLLMVSALRCRAMGRDIIGHYNNFVRENRNQLAAANDTLRAQFTAEGAGLNGYDRYVTQLANRYGAGAGGFDCDEAAGLINSARRGGATLVQLAGHTITAPFGSRACPVSVARARR
jgi:hypothetical protein